jgi:arylsulfatase A-like enzyme
MDICCGATDRATWALVTDLKRRGMLDDTLIVWGGEFGRTPMFQGKGGPGRDHHMKGFSIWMAGGGIRGGLSHGATDELGYNSVENVVHVRDMHATMLHLLGIDHERFSIRHQGLDSRLTGVEPAAPIREIL